MPYVAIKRNIKCYVVLVVYKDNVHDYVKDFQLGRFLDAGKIIKFQRCTGWVIVGIDPVRTRIHTAYRGAERRTGAAIAQSLLRKKGGESI